MSQTPEQPQQPTPPPENPKPQEPALQAAAAQSAGGVIQPAGGAVATAPPVPPGHQGPPPGYPPAGTAYWARPPVRRPAPPGFMQTRWVGPVTPANLYTLLGILLGGLGFALALPLDRPGIGWPIAGLAAGIGAGVAARRSNAEVSTSDRIMRVVWAVAALALLSLSAFRSSGLLTFFCAITALACASLAAAGGRSLRAMLFGVFAAPLAGFRSIPWVVRGIGAIAAARAARKSEAAAAAGTTGEGATPEQAAAKRDRNGNFIVSGIIALILLLVFGALFVSADAVFAHYTNVAFEWVGKIIPDLDAPNLILRLFLLGVGLLITAGGVFLATAPPDLSGMENPGKPVLGRDLLLLPLGTMAVLFIGFVAVQFTALFGGNNYVLRHSQVDYAEYAVGGFQQLVFVSILTLVIVGVAARYGHKESPKDRLLIRVLLGALCGLSIVIVWSALYRLNLYVNTYGLTRERFAVFMLEIFLGIMFLLVLLAGIRMRAPWLSRAVFGVGVVMLFGAGAMNPEAWIAQHNIDRYQKGEKIDLYYLNAMTADAVPALINLPEDQRNCVLGAISRELDSDRDEWFEWNYARAHARQILADQFPNGFAPCKGRRSYDYPR